MLVFIMNCLCKVFLILIVVKTITSSRHVNYWKYNGDECITECSRGGYPYNWCYTVLKKWRYCSATDGYDIYDRKCVNGCDSNQKLGCLLSESSSAGPSRREECSEIRILPTDWTIRSEPCINTCATYGYSYSWCYIKTNYKWDYC